MFTGRKVRDKRDPLLPSDTFRHYNNRRAVILES